MQFVPKLTRICRLRVCCFLDRNRIAEAQLTEWVPMSEGERRYIMGVGSDRWACGLYQLLIYFVLDYGVRVSFGPDLCYFNRFRVYITSGLSC